MFSDYNRVINSSKTDATYKITDISLEYDIVTQPDLARFRETEELARVKAQLKRSKHTCLIMKMEHPRTYEIR